MLDELMESEDESFETILLNLMDVKNIITKTEIFNPMAFAQLRTFAQWFRAEGFPKIGKIIENFLVRYMEYMVSYERKGRTEIISALTEGLKREKSLTDKLTKAPD